MIKTGLVSITFRQFTPEQIVEMVARAGLDEIEWGGDVHVPHGDIAQAQRVAEITQNAGLSTGAYGSYYRVGEDEGPCFKDVLASAVSLKADKIRVWVGRKGSEQADAAYRGQVIEDAKRISDLAGDKGVTIVSEWHGNTLMDQLDSAMDFLAEVGRDNFKTYWQPLVDRPVEVCLNEIDTIIPNLVGMHVFAWTGVERLALSEHRSRWEKYFDHAKAAGNFTAFLEFVQEDSQEAFERDAAELKEILL